MSCKHDDGSNSSMHICGDLKRNSYILLSHLKNGINKLTGENLTMTVPMTP